MTAENKVRLFIGARVSIATLRELSDVVRAMRKRAAESDLQVKWVTPATYHVTLKFLGWTRADAIEAIRDRLSMNLIHVKPLSFPTQGVGAFPSLEKARVLWAGVEDRDEGLAKIAALLDETLVELGFSRDKRPFHPHVTLGRFKEVVDARELVQSTTEQKFSTTRVDSIVLYESSINTDGSEYVIHAEWPLESSSRR